MSHSAVDSVAGLALQRKVVSWHVSPGAWLLFPLVAFLAVFYVYPVTAMLARSVHPQGWSLAPYRDLLQDDVFAHVLSITLSISATVTLACLLLAFPVAYWLARMPPPRANLLLLLVLVPFWTSILVRSYAWMALLERHGIINALLLWAGATARPMRMLNTRFAVCLAMVHVLLPFMVLPIYATLRAMDWRLLLAAQSLGATRWRTLRQVVLPLARPGIAAGVTLVFTLSVGFYITPVLVGGPSDVMAAMLISDQVSNLAWPRAAAMAAVLLALVLAVTTGLSRLLGARYVPPGVV
jgi:putative spermidine/putrescine transport system permease protein